MTAEAVDAFEYAARQFEVRGYESPWRRIARPSQLMPDLALAWFVWLFLAGRGAGKTRSAAEAIAELMRRYPGCRVALVAQTFADGRDTMVEGDSGLLSVFDASELRGGDPDAAWNRSTGELYLANGSRAKVYSSEKPRKLRGPQFHFSWCDELATFKDAHRDRSELDTTWSNLMLGMRLPRQAGWPDDYRPRVLVTTTPRRVAVLRVPAQTAREHPHKAGLLQMDPDTVVVTRGRTHDNLENLADTYRQQVVEPLVGTRLGRQELDAEMLDDVQGALLQQAWIDAGRRRADEIPPLVVKAIGIDPATTNTDSSDLTGLAAVGVDEQLHGYVLDDRSDRYSPDEWATTAWQMAIDWEADVVVVEDNAGGDMVETTLLAAWHRISEQQRAIGNPQLPRPPIMRVTPSGPTQTKWLRAQPVALLYEQQPPRIHHVMPVAERGGAVLANPLAQFEDQATSWTGDKDEPSPDRVDAVVHPLRWLLFPGSRVKKPAGTRRGAQGSTSQRWSGGGRR